MGGGLQKSAWFLFLAVLLFGHEEQSVVDAFGVPISGGVRQTRTSSTSSSSTELNMFRKMAASIQAAVRFERKEDLAEVSAGIYMNPMTQKLANITVSWEPRIAQEIVKAKQAKAYPVSRPFMVGVVGIPGSGKSTSSDILASILPNSIVMPMDGYHYSMEVLESFPDATDLIYRRGAPDTFDPLSLSCDLDRIVHGTESQVMIPGFDHAVGDPTPDQHVFYRNLHQVVICEGIYLMHQDDGWESIKDYMDMVVYIDADINLCIDRLKERNKCIPGYTPEEIDIRCDAVDRVNAETVCRSRHYATVEVRSGAA